MNSTWLGCTRFHFIAALFLACISFPAKGAIVLDPGSPTRPASPNLVPPPVLERQTNPAPAPLVRPKTNAPVMPKPVVTTQGNQASRVMVDLRDGSRLYASPALNKLPVQTALGLFDVDLGKVDSIQFLDDKERAAILFRAGDRLTGTLKLDALDLQTSFGPVRIPPKLVKRIGISAGGTEEIKEPAPPKM